MFVSSIHSVLHGAHQLGVRGLSISGTLLSRISSMKGKIFLGATVVAGATGAYTFKKSYEKMQGSCEEMRKEITSLKKAQEEANQSDSAFQELSTRVDSFIVGSQAKIALLLERKMEEDLRRLENLEKEVRGVQDQLETKLASFSRDEKEKRSQEFKHFFNCAFLETMYSGGLEQKRREALAFETGRETGRNLPLCEISRDPRSPRAVQFQVTVTSPEVLRSLLIFSRGYGEIPRGLPFSIEERQ